MRIIGGTARGRRLASPPGRKGKTGKHLIRPTLDSSREAIFNIIDAEIVNAVVLDLFAGTGALGLEAISRGARFSVFVDYHRQSLDLIEKNIETCGFADQALVFRRDLGRGLHFLTKRFSPGEFNLVFIDPPYGKGLAAALLCETEKHGLLAGDGLLVVEASGQDELPEQVGRMILSKKRQYGDSAFLFYRQEQEAGKDG